MPRKPNYDFERRQKEQARKTKKEAKRAERQQRRDERRDEVGEDAPADSTSGEEGATPDTANEGGGNA